MNWLETFRTGWDAIRSHRLRSGLTMLGILIGIAAVAQRTIRLRDGQIDVTGELARAGAR